MDIQLWFFVAFLILYGVSVFVPERVLVVLSGIAAIATGVVVLFRNL